MAKKSAVIVVSSEGTDKFCRDMDKSANSVRKFGKSGSESSSGIEKMMSSIGKFASAIAVASTATAAFNKAINSCQTYGDKFNVLQNQMKDSVNAFFYSISTGDFTVFENGLENLIKKSERYQTILDQLGNTSMSYSAIQAEENQNFQRSVMIMKDETKSISERTAAYKSASEAIKNMRSGASYMQQDLVDALKGAIAKDSALDASQISWDAIAMAIKANATEWGREGGIERAKAEYQAYLDEWNAAQKQYGHYTYNKKTWSGFVQMTNEGNPEMLAAEQQRLNEKYKDQIVLFTALEKYGDDFLKTLTDQYSQYFNLSSAIDAYEQRLIKLRGTMDKLYTVAPRIEGPTFNGKISGGSILGNTLSAQANRGSSKTVNDAALNRIGGSNLLGAGDSSTIESIGSIGEDAKQSSVDVNSLVGSVESLGDAFTNLEETFDGCSSAWDYMSKTMQVSMQIVNAAKSFTSAFTLAKQEETVAATESAAAAGADAVAKTAEAAAVTAVAVASGADTGTKATDTAATAADAAASTADAVAKTAEAAAITAVAAASGVDTGAKTADTTATAASAAASVTNASVKAVETGAVAADATMQLTDSVTKAMNAHSWIPYVGVALGAAAVGAILATVMNLPKFETGGVVGGDSYHGDRLLARLNSGEGVLTRDGMKNLNNIVSSSDDSGSSSAFVGAEDIVMKINNYGRRTGRGRLKFE